MKPWPKHPVIYEINTWVWLNEFSRKYDKPLTLATVPADEWDYLSSIGADAVWFMGVWERSPKGVQVALNNEGLMADFRRALPDFMTEDVVGSPYCVRRYVVDSRLGGPEGLAAARNMLSERGLRLILDFVPNHVAPDSITRTSWSVLSKTMTSREPLQNFIRKMTRCAPWGYTWTSPHGGTMSLAL